MNNKVKGLIIGGVFVLCLIVVMLALKLTEPKDDTSSVADTSSAEDKVATYIYEYESKDIVNIKVENIFTDERHNGQFTVTKQADNSFLVDEAEGFNQATSYTAAIANCAAAVEYQTLVEENASDLEKYGLADPIAKFTVNFADNTSKTMYIGSSSPEDGYTYVCEGGKNTVYTALTNSVYYFLATPENFVRTLLVEEPADNAWPYLNSLKVTREDLPGGHVLFVADETEPEDEDFPTQVAAQMIIEPVYSYLDIVNSGAVTHGIWGLTASEIVILHPDELDLEIGGIDKPYTTVEYVCDGGELTYKLLIGNPYYETDEDGEETTTVAGYFAYLEGFDALLKLSVDSASWATFTIESVNSTMMTSNYINSLDYMTIEITDGENDATYSFDLNYDKVAEILHCELNGSEIEEEYFKSLYLFFLKCPVEEIWMDEPVTECRMKITVATRGGKIDTLEFFKDTERRTIIKLNGVTSYRQTTTYLERLISNLEGMLEGEEIVMEW